MGFLSSYLSGPLPCVESHYLKCVECVIKYKISFLTSLIAKQRRVVFIKHPAFRCSGNTDVYTVIDSSCVITSN